MNTCVKQKLYMVETCDQNFWDKKSTLSPDFWPDVRRGFGPGF